MRRPSSAWRCLDITEPTRGVALSVPIEALSVMLACPVVSQHGLSRCHAKEMKRFESFRLDPVNHCLWRGGTRVLIAPKAFDVLLYLVERPGMLVSQDEILDALWPNTYVNPEVIKKYILSIRRVLGDDIARP